TPQRFLFRVFRICRGFSLAGRHGDGKGAHWAVGVLSRLAHFFHMARSASILMNTPLTTERACKPSFRGLSVQYQAVMGTRSVVSLRKRKTGDTRAWKSSCDSAMVAVHKIQSSLV